MYGFKIFIFLWVLVGAIFCLYALSTDKIKVLVNDRPLLETAIAIMAHIIAMTALLKKRRRKSKSFVNYMIYLSSAWNPTI